MWEEATCLRFRENTQARDAIRYVLERGDSCFTEFIGRNGGYQDIIIGSECAEVIVKFQYVLERGDSCFTEFIGRNGGYQDIIIGSECAEVIVKFQLVNYH
uniref:Peptidase M12A domain-containing protein n=1 Tax=Ascaris lumbricoides TaxID=6252 RepID=A0A0M3IVZ2_ASCLU